MPDGSSHRDAFKPFPATPWSLVGRAAHATIESRRESLEALLSRYLPALRTHLLYKKRLAPDRADDLLQGFIADKVVAAEILSHADRERGKFRTFLCTALDRYLISQTRMDRARKRMPGPEAGGTGTGPAIADIDTTPEQPADATTPGDSFDVAWARQLIDRAVTLMQAECESGGRKDLWELFDLRVLGPTLRGTEPPPYEDLLARTGATSPLKLSNLLVTAKRMYVRILRNVISEYARDESEVDEEMRDLKTILSRD
jgi:RNA polymerase sigma-70 factor (ECF subfamily)